MSSVRKAYLNQRWAGSFSGLSGFLRNRKEWAKRKPEVEKELRGIRAYALHKDARKRFPRRKIYVNYVNEVWSADLKDISNIAPYNNCNFWILVVVDTLSKRAYTRMLKNKSAPRVIAAFKSIFKEADAKPELLFTDRGK